MAQEGPAADAKPMTDAFLAYADEAGRADQSRPAYALAHRIHARKRMGSAHRWLAGAIGATELAVYPHGEVLDDYLVRLRRFKDMFGV